MLQGKHVVLRPTRKGDIELLLKWYNDPEIIQNIIHRHLPFCQEAAEEWIRQLGLSKKEMLLVIEVKKNDASIPIGIAGISHINWKDRNASGSIIIGEKEYWGKGIGAELAELFLDYCFNELNLHRISTSVISTNERSLKLHQKLGFVVEGRIKEAVYKMGRYQDIILLGLLKRDWITEKRE